MSRPLRRPVLAGLGLAILTACAEPPPPPPTNPRLVATPPVSQALVLTLVSTQPGPDGRLRVAVDVANPSGADFPLRYQVEWFDASARPINTAQSRTQFRSIPRFGAATLSADAPNLAARDFRMQLDVDAP